MIDNGDWEFIWIYGLNLWILWGSRTSGILTSDSPSPISGILPEIGATDFTPDFRLADVVKYPLVN